MAMTEDLLRIMGYDRGPDDNAEVNIKIKPLGNMAQQAAAGAQGMNAPSEPTTSGLGASGGSSGVPSGGGGGNPQLLQRPGAATPPNYLTDPYGMPGMIPPGTNFGNPGNGPWGGLPGDQAGQQFGRTGLPGDVVPPGGTPAPPGNIPPAAYLVGGNTNTTPTQPGQSTTTPPTSPGATGGYGAGGQSIVPVNQRVAQKAPSLQTHPLGKYTDDVYEAAIAQLQYETTNNYLKLLQDLGWMDADGNFIPGLLETEAVRKRDDLNFNMGLALKDVNDTAMRGSTGFSGKRALNLSNAQRPYDAALGNLETTLGRELAARYAGLGELTRGFELQRNLLLGEAAERLKASLQGGPAGDPVGDGPPEDGGPPPEEGSTPPPQFWGSKWGAHPELVPQGYFGITVGSSYGGNRYYAPTGQPGVKTLIIDRAGRIQGYVDLNGNTVKWYGGVPTGGGGPPLKPM